MLAIAGYQPELGRCVVCRKDAQDMHEHWFSQSRGGLVCGNCFQGAPGHAKLSWGTIRMLQRAQTIELAKISRLFFSSHAREESRRILPHFIEYRIEKPLTSLRLIRRLEESQAQYINNPPTNKAGSA